MTTPRRAPLVVAVLGIAALFIAACGLPTDHRPRAIDPSQLPDILQPTTGPTTTVASPGAPVAQIFYVNTKLGTLVSLNRRVNQGAKPAAVLRLLLLTPLSSREKAMGLSTLIPPRTQLLGATLDGSGTLTVNLSKEIDSIVGQNQKTAYAQLVFTATAIDGVERVRFLTDGTLVEVLTDDGPQPVIDHALYNNPYQIGDGGGSTDGPSTTIGGAVPPVPN